jgi:hypothetical protein
MFRRKKKTEEISIKPLEVPKTAPKGHNRTSPSRPVSRVDLKNVPKPSSLQDIEAAIKTKKMHAIPAPAKQVDTAKPHHIKKEGAVWGLFPDASKTPQETFKTQKEALLFAQSQNLQYILYSADGKPKA